MKAIILAAGYATRMYPLTKNYPKPLLPLGNKTILDYIIAKVEEVEEVNEIVIVTNNSFISHFQNWKEKHHGKTAITILNDGTTSNDNRLGALSDLYFAVKSCKAKDDVLVLAGDNLFDFSLVDMINYYHNKGNNVIAANRIDSLDLLRRTGVVSVGEDNSATKFEEKPQMPDSNLGVPPFYIYSEHTVTRLLPEFLENMQNLDKKQWDAPGNLIPYLINKDKVYVWLFEGKRYDVGSLESYEAIKKMYNNKHLD